MRYRTITSIALMICVSLFCFGPALLPGQENLDDADITIAVETKLVVEEAVPSHKIDVATEAGIVTLSGSVDSYRAKLSAEVAAESVKGVKAVVNDIEVTPSVRDDTDIHSDLVAALAMDPVVESFEVDVSVEDGIVTLSGEVGTYAERMIAEEVAEDIAGVVDVSNLLVYDPVTNRTDVDIQDDIKNRLRADASIDAGLIEVVANDGEVMLTGSVGSAAEKNEAGREAWIVPGVQDVTNMLEVKWWLDGGASDWATSWTNADMERAIDNMLLSNPRVNSFNVTTTVDDGVAILRGTVDNLQAKRAAEEEADDVLGVWRVKNHLKVRTALTRTDMEIADDIRDALRRNPYTDRYDVVVDVYDGKAYLNGEVDSWYMKDQAERAAAGVPGVVEIQNNLDVDYQFTAKTDREIKDDIESELWWSPFVDSDDIAVEVRSGVATLTGTVEDYDEFEAARDNARQGGATSVITKLTIESGYGAD